MDIMVVVNQMIQLFLIMGLGYFMMKKKILNYEVNKKLNYIILSITTPCLIISSVCGENDASKDVVLYVLLVAIVVYLLLPVLSFLLVKIMRIKKSQQGLFMFMTIFSNTGFMGFPVMKSIFGNTAVFYTAIFNMLFNLEVYTLGVVLMNYGKNDRVKLDPKNLLSPGVVTSILAIIIYFLEIPLPTVLLSSCESVGNMTTPLAMMLIGASLANIRLKDIFNDFIVYPYTLIKQILIPIIAFPIICYFIKDFLIQGVTLLNIAMPVGNSAVLFATEYDGDVPLAAKTVFLTTLFSVLSIPLIVSLLSF